MKVSIATIPFSQPESFDPKIALEIKGHYENEVMTLDVFVEGDKLKLEVLMKKEIRHASDKELPPDHDPFYFDMLPGKPDEYMITSGAFIGQRGYFTRDDNNKITGVDLAGRLFSRKMKDN